MRSTRPGSIQAAVQAAYTANGGVENVSEDLGLSLSTVSYGTASDEARPGGIGVNYLDRLGRMCPDAAAAIARHFARLAGGRFMPDRGRASGEDPLHHATRLIRESAEGTTALMALSTGGSRADARRELVDIRNAVDAAILDLDAQDEAGAVATVPLRGVVR